MGGGVGGGSENKEPWVAPLPKLPGSRAPGRPLPWELGQSVRPGSIIASLSIKGLMMGSGQGPCI